MVNIYKASIHVSIFKSLLAHYIAHPFYGDRIVFFYLHVGITSSSVQLPVHT